MEVINNLAYGFSIAVEPTNLLFCFIGTVLGTLIGVLPGIGPAAGIAMLIPISAGLSPTTAIIMLAGIYYGAMYGGSTTAILINTPGEAAAVLTSLDGFQMAKQGRAGAALAMAAIGSFVAGTLSIVGLTIMAPPLADFALTIGPPEYFALMMLGMSIVVSLAGTSLLKGLVAAAFGLLIATIGIDPQAGVSRFTFGNSSLMGGVDFISMVVGLFAVAEILSGIEAKSESLVQNRMSSLWPTRQDWKESCPAILRGTVVGFIIGLLPGGNVAVAASISYDAEKKFSEHPERFGKGAIAGVAGPESANNSATGAGMIPLMTLGIPSSASLAILMGALMIHGLRPGPLLFEQNPDFVWGVIASMYIGNAMLLVLNLPLLGLWARLATVPLPVLGPSVLVLCFVGTYGVRNSMFDVWVAVFFGVLGYILRKLDVPTVPMVLALILEPMIEASLRQSLAISHGSVSIFLTRPVAAGLIVAGVVSLTVSLYARRRQPSYVSANES